MAFLGSAAWYTLLFTACVAVLVRQFGMCTNGTMSPTIAIAATLGTWMVVLVVIWRTGWLGALILAGAAWWIAPVVADLLLFPVLRQGTLTTFSDFRARVPWRVEQPDMTVEGLMASWERDRRDYEAIARHPAIARLLARRAKDAGEIGRIEGDIRKLGFGRRIARKVVSDPRLLEEHYALEARGISGHELAQVYLERFGPPP